MLKHPSSTWPIEWRRICTAVILIALATLIVWAVISPESGMVLTAPVAVLLVACPCAMGLATPTAILVGTGRAARMGILFRNGEILEKMSKASTFVFDKTGTLTEGRPAVSRFIPAEGITAETLLQYAASAEQFSEHPFGKAIRARALKDGMKLFPAANHHNQPGLGLTAEVDGKTAVVGNRVYLSSAGLSAEYEAAMNAWRKRRGPRLSTWRSTAAIWAPFRWPIRSRTARGNHQATQPSGLGDVDADGG